jgi:hypothetical protein
MHFFMHESFLHTCILTHSCLLVDEDDDPLYASGLLVVVLGRVLDDRVALLDRVARDVEDGEMLPFRLKKDKFY